MIVMLLFIIVLILFMNKFNLIFFLFEKKFRLNVIFEFKKIKKKFIEIN